MRGDYTTKYRGRGFWGKPPKGGKQSQKKIEDNRDRIKYQSSRDQGEREPAEEQESLEKSGGEVDRP